MIVRIWRTSIHPDGVEAYVKFAIERSQPMFRQQHGFLGVLFLRSDGDCAVVSIWESLEDVGALESSERYRNTVRALEAADVLTGEQTVEVFGVEGGEFGNPAKLAGRRLNARG